MALFQGPVSGVVNSPNPFSAAPVGSLKVATNVRFVAPGVLAPRRGMDLWTNASFGSAESRANQVTFYDGKTVIHYDTNGDNAAVAVRLSEETTFVDFEASANPAGDYRMRFVGASRSLFWNTSRGVYVWDGSTATRLGFEDASGAFTMGEVIVGDDSGATGTIWAGSDLDGDGTFFLIDVTGTFQDEETVTGDTSTETATVAGAPTTVPLPPPVAGNPEGLWLEVSSMNDGTGAWLPADSAVAYRFTICSTDRFGRVIEGPPSGRLVVRNQISIAVGGLVRTGGNTVTATTQGNMPHYLNAGDVVALTPGEADFASGNKTVATVPTASTFTYTEAGSNVSSALAQEFEATRYPVLKVYFEEVLSPGDFIRLYRSEMTSSADITPSDELFLTYETAPIVDGDEVGNITITDTAPQDRPGPPLYTNANDGGDGLGLKGANYQPPVCNDMAFFSSRMWFANTTNRQSLNLALIGIGSPDGLQDGDELTIGVEGFSVTLEGTTGTPGSSTEFHIETSLDIPGNIAATAQNIVACINQISSEFCGVYGYYTSADSDAPGQMRFDERMVEGLTQGVQFFATCDRPNAFSPPAVEAPLPLLKSDNNRHPAGLFYSKLGQPEAVPPINFMLVGSDNDPILRICPLNFRLIVFKTDGIYSISDSEPFSQQKISEARLVAPDSVGLLGETLHAFTDLGWVVISDATVTPISAAIDDQSLAPLFGAPLEDLKVLTVGCGYQTARQYLMFFPEDESSTVADNAWVYSTLSGGFTRYGLSARAVGVDPSTDQLVIAPSDENCLLIENKSFTLSDYADRSREVDIVSVGPGPEVDANTLAIWHLNEANGHATAEDAGGNYPLPSVTVGGSGEPTAEPGVFGNARTFGDGSNVRGPISAAIATKFASGGSWTLDFWITVNSTPTALQGVMGCTSDDGTTWPFYITYWSVSNNLHVGHQDTGNYAAPGALAVVPVGERTHVAITSAPNANPAIQDWTWYINGVSFGTTSAADSSLSVGATPRWSLARSFNGSTTNASDITLDEVRIQNGVRTAPEIAAYAAAGHDEPSNIITIDPADDPPEVGDVIVDEDAEGIRVVSVDGDTVTLASEGYFPNTTYSMVGGIACEVEFNKITGGQPATMKQWNQASLLFRDNSMEEIEVFFKTEVDETESTVTLTNPNWTAEDPQEDTQQIKRIEPIPIQQGDACQLSVGFRTNQAYAAFELLGVSVVSKVDTDANRGGG